MSGSVLTPHEKIARGLARSGDDALSLLLVAIGIALIIIGLLPDHVAFKAIVGAWVILP